MLKFSDWILSRESSATTRAREAWARYNAYPPSAGFTSHSSGPAFVWDKMKKEFPDKSFVVEYVYDKEYGDCGLTFYQRVSSN